MVMATSKRRWRCKKAVAKATSRLPKAISMAKMKSPRLAAQLRAQGPAAPGRRLGQVALVGAPEGQQGAQQREADEVPERDMPLKSIHFPFKIEGNPSKIIEIPWFCLGKWQKLAGF